MQRLVDRVAVITGAGSGIGLASVRRLAAEGARIVAVDIDGESGKAAAEEAGGIFVQADVTSEDDVQAVYDTAAAEFGASTSPSTTRGSLRPRTTPSWSPALTRGSGCRR